MWTGDERVFFYNPSQNVSVWDCPEEIEDRADVKKLIQTPPRLMQQAAAAVAGNTHTVTFTFSGASDLPFMLTLHALEIAVLLSASLYVSKRVAY